jgi:hypothetical protein
VSFSRGQRSLSPEMLYNLKVHHRVQKSRPPIPILSQTNPVHKTHSISLTSILMLSSHPRTIFLRLSQQNLIRIPLPFPCVLHTLPTIPLSYMSKTLAIAGKTCHVRQKTGEGEAELCILFCIKDYGQSLVLKHLTRRKYFAEK